MFGGGGGGVVCVYVSGGGGSLSLVRCAAFMCLLLGSHFDILVSINRYALNLKGLKGRFLSS